MPTIAYQLTKRELILTGTVRKLLRTRTLISIGVLFVSAIMLILIGDSFRVLGWFALGFALLTPLLFMRVLQRVVNANPVLTSPITMTFDDDGIVSAATGQRSEREWKSFASWSDSDKYFFLHIDTLGTAVTIPKRAFTESELELFKNNLTQIGVQPRLAKNMTSDQL